MRTAPLLLLATLGLAACAHDGAAPAAPEALVAGCETAPSEGFAFGCANDANLRAMLADPRDLEHGAAGADARGDAATRPAERYRQGQVQLPTTAAAEPTINVSMQGK